jgi:hypothetical protein
MHACLRITVARCARSSSAGSCALYPGRAKPLSPPAVTTSTPVLVRHAPDAWAVAAKGPQRHKHARLDPSSGLQRSAEGGAAAHTQGPRDRSAYGCRCGTLRPCRSADRCGNRPRSERCWHSSRAWQARQAAAARGTAWAALHRQPGCVTGGAQCLLASASRAQHPGNLGLTAAADLRVLG